MSLLTKIALILMLQSEMKLELVAAQEPLRSNGGNIPFDTGLQDSISLPSRSQAIVTSYQFQCSGFVTGYSIYAHQVSNDRFTFQVWRPGPSVETTGCYSLVGETVSDIRSIPVRNRIVSFSALIPFQPGDVVGFVTDVGRFEATGGNAEVQLEPRDNGIGESVWYSEGPPTNMGGACPLPVGAEEGRILRSFTNAAPIISVDVGNIDTSSCIFLSPQVITPGPVTEQATATTNQPPSISEESITTTLTQTEQLSTQQAKSPSEVSMWRSDGPTNGPTTNTGVGLSVRDIGIIAGVCVSAVLVGTLVILGSVIAIHRRKIRKLKYLQVHNSGLDTLKELKDNAAYIPTNILTESISTHVPTSFTSMEFNADYINMSETNAAYYSIPGPVETSAPSYSIPVETNAAYVPANSIPVETNAAYIPTPSIPVETNAAYIPTPSIPVDTNAAYILTPSCNNYDTSD